MNAAYERDFYGWANEQAKLLRSGRLAEADIGNIAEEIESMGRSERRELVSRLRVLLLHLLKWQFQPERQGSSWRGTIRTQRVEIRNHLLDNPSLKPHLPKLIATAYELGCLEAVTETGLRENTFPDICPWTFEQIASPDFLPA
jgi:hypothetical protein